MRIDLGQVRPSQVGRIRPVEVAVKATVSTGGQQPVEYRWVLGGRVRRHLDCAPLTLSLGEDLVVARTAEPRIVSIRREPGVESVRIKRLPAGWKGSIRTATNGAGTDELTLAPRREAVGAFQEFIELEALAPGGRVAGTQTIRAEGRAVESVEVLPRVVDLGPVPVGSRYRTVLTVTTRGGAPVELDDLDPSNDPAIRFVMPQTKGVLQVEIVGVVPTPGHGETTGVFRVRPNGPHSVLLSYHIRWYGVKGEPGEGGG